MQISIIGYKIGNHPKLSFDKCKIIFDENKDELSYYNILEFPVEMFYGGNSFKNISSKVTIDVTKSSEAFIRYRSIDFHP